MVSSTDESYDPHARMHESFPRADSGSTQVAGEVIPLKGEDSMGSPAGTKVQNIFNAGKIYRGEASDDKAIPIRRPR